MKIFQWKTNPSGSEFPIISPWCAHYTLIIPQLCFRVFFILIKRVALWHWRKVRTKDAQRGTRHLLVKVIRELGTCVAGVHHEGNGVALDLAPPHVPPTEYLDSIQIKPCQIDTLWILIHQLYHNICVYKTIKKYIYNTNIYIYICTSKCQISSNIIKYLEIREIYYACHCMPLPESSNKHQRHPVAARVPWRTQGPACDEGEEGSQCLGEWLGQSDGFRK